MHSFWEINNWKKFREIKGVKMWSRISVNFLPLKLRLLSQRIFEKITPKRSTGCITIIFYILTFSLFHLPSTLVLLCLSIIILSNSFNRYFTIPFLLELLILCISNRAFLLKLPEYQDRCPWRNKFCGDRRTSWIFCACQNLARRSLLEGVK